MACQTAVTSDCIVDIPDSALEDSSQQILTTSAGSASLHHKPSIPDNVIRQAGLPVPFYGIAFDLGTTTLVGTLYNLSDGAECGVASALNGQIPFGDDVVARIENARKNPASAKAMQKAAADSLNAIIRELCEKNSISHMSIVDFTLAGNTAMQQLVCNMDVTALGEIPFTPAFFEPQTLPLAEIGLLGNDAARCFIFPQIGGFVGGDTVAGIITGGLDRVTAPTLFMDIGTNGEIVLALPGGKILATSAAAGPAFEGARISNGMRATRGAIDKLEFRDGAFAYTTIGNAEPIGLCGTALIDAVAALLSAGLLDVTGLILDNDTVQLAPKVTLTQRDIRELQLASGALRAASEMLLQRAGITANDLDVVLLAGAFGNYVRRENALRIGMFPAVPVERVKFIGNAASHGARMALLSTDERDRAAKAAKTAEHIELGADPEFQMAFAMAMMFPE
jgi:uncharacterized 2Fe-2S/4Fe-4S cluster protein (DUF4445 family)